MKKALFGLLALSAVSTAAADSVGGFIGTGAGVYYRNELTVNSSVRYALNLNAVNLFRGGSLALGGDVAYLGQIRSGATLAGFNPYYGLGLGADVSLGSNNYISVYPHGLLGLEYQVTTPLSIFVEGSVGPSLSIGNGGLNFDFLGFGARVGVNYTFR
ncbi:hypothetical protein DAETH_27220 [Deinococcus aetherius]|uniref:Outer membrane protein beta-barrel domain-containing protein n=1 Tax=Deinococcus aetherius TaxID=200252 RepID=A0ABN6RJ28_9DEIO|nr:hypothetical protein [Deinococcus aetherius]BDP42753.1 hypothetical protein DAETH_27220 [Deinococcus aetherius]